MTLLLRAFALTALLLLVGASARAEKWALLIGINDYEDRNVIASLGSADTDARELKKTLKAQLGFPEANITLLVSDGDKKPTRANILEALGELGENAKPGDTVFVFYSGHGIEVEGQSCLLPYDFRGKSKFAGIETALEISKFKSLLGQVKARALVMVWDMCRNDPFAKGKSGDAKRNVLSDTKGWQVTPLTPHGAEASIVANFFACSSGETSFEWTDKNRGYFAYFLEQGMKGEAADEKGNITLGGLAKYVQTRVATITKNNEGKAQNPFPEFGGAGATDYVLATGPAPRPAEPTAPEVLTPMMALQRIRAAHRANALSTTMPVRFSGTATGAVASWRIARNDISAVLAPATNEFRKTYGLIQERDKLQARIVVGFGDGKAWRTVNGKRVSIGNDFWKENPLGPLLAVLAPSATTLPPKDYNNAYTDQARLGGSSLWLSVPKVGVFKVHFNRTTFKILGIVVRSDGNYPVFQYSDYHDVDGLPLPFSVVDYRIRHYVATNTYGPEAIVTTKYTRIERATETSPTLFLRP